MGASLVAALAVCAMALAPQVRAQSQPSASASALLTQYCVVCHDNQKRTAGVTLQGLDLNSIGDHAQLLERVLRKVAARQMPPSGVPRPDAARLARFST